MDNKEDGAICKMNKCICIICIYKINISNCLKNNCNCSYDDITQDYNLTWNNPNGETMKDDFINTCSVYKNDWVKELKYGKR